MVAAMCSLVVYTVVAASGVPSTPADDKTIVFESFPSGPIEDGELELRQPTLEFSFSADHVNRYRHSVHNLRQEMFPQGWGGDSARISTTSAYIRDWVCGVGNPAQIVDIFPMLSLAEDVELRSALYTSGRTTGWIVFDCVPEEEGDMLRDFPIGDDHFRELLGLDQEEDPWAFRERVASCMRERWDDHFANQFRFKIMHKIEGPDCPEAYLEASLLWRAMHMFVYSDHHYRWWGHALIIEKIPTKKIVEAAEARWGTPVRELRTSRDEWRWIMEHPASLVPTVHCSAKHVVVRFYAFEHHMGYNCIYEHRDVYDRGSFLPMRTTLRAVAVGEHECYM